LSVEKERDGKTGGGFLRNDHAVYYDGEITDLGNVCENVQRAGFIGKLYFRVRQYLRRRVHLIDIGKKLKELDMETAKTIGTNLKYARKAKGYTQKEVAARLRMTQQQYSRFETGKFELNYDQIFALCALYEITPNELFER
jgi:DNA-binding XRE family transcriptional regulator